MGLHLQAGPVVTTDSPIGFFTNVASRLLQSQLGLSLNHIQLYPTNQYTPSVHWLLQVTANLYDASTVRTFNVPTATNGYPSVFRPVFTHSGPSPHMAEQVFISGFEEVTNTAVLLQPVVDLTDFESRSALKAGDDLHMVYGIPLVIGAKKGLPNFNKFAMQTQVQVTRKLQFHRQGTSNTGPINEIDQMFVVGLTNTLGVEAWNSYASAFPPAGRSLSMVVVPCLTVTLSNLETGHLLNPNSYTNSMTTGLLNITGNTWPGYNPANESPSFLLPLASGPGGVATNVVFIPNATYQASSDSFVPLTGNFERTPGSTNLHVPHWQLNVRTRLRYALIDFSLTPNRILDYVNLDSTETPVDITDALMRDTPTSYSSCGPGSGPYQPSATPGSMWCTNRIGGSTADFVLTFGVMNQIEASRGLTSPDWTGSRNEFLPGMNTAQAVAFFTGQFTPGYFYSSNTFKAPFQPFRNVYIITEWEVNDPLVHYMIGDLKNTFGSNSFAFDPLSYPVAPLPKLGRLNNRYEPWGGNPRYGAINAPAYELRVKDPVASTRGYSDYWDFPTNLVSDLTGLGRVHRGTPWQTIYLKAPAIDVPTWTQWTGDTQLVTNWNGINGIAYDAYFTLPTNDWRLASLLVSLLSTNDPRSLASVNQPGVPGWCGLLNGMTVLTNSAPGELDPVIMSSNSPQAATIAAALDVRRSSQPGQRFHDPGDILATPELSVASPWLNTNSDVGSGPSEEAYEAIPSQLLPRLRPDSSASVSQIGGTLQVQFSGADGCAYAVQTSANLHDWTAVSTNYPVNGVFIFVATPAPGASRRFYRSVLQP